MGHNNVVIRSAKRDSVSLQSVSAFGSRPGTGITVVGKDFIGAVTLRTFGKKLIGRHCEPHRGAALHRAGQIVSYKVAHSAADHQQPPEACTIHILEEEVGGDVSIAVPNKHLMPDRPLLDAVIFPIGLGGEGQMDVSVGDAVIVD